MRLYVDTSRTQFQVTRETVEKVDQHGRQKTDRSTQEPLWTVQVLALDERDDRGGELLNVALAGQQAPKVTIGAQVVFGELEAIPWATNGKNGVAFRAKSVGKAGS